MFTGITDWFYKLTVTCALVMLWWSPLSTTASSCNGLEYSKFNCFYMSASLITFQTNMSMVNNTKNLCHLYGNPKVSIDCKAKTLVYLNYTKGSADNETDFYLKMEFNRTGESDSWHISYLEYKNYTKSGANLVVFNNSEVSKEINGFVQQAFECDSVTVTDLYKKSFITFENILIQPFDTNGYSASPDKKNCHEETDSPVAGIVIGSVAGGCILLALLALVIILLYKRVRYGQYNLLHST